LPRDWQASGRGPLFRSARRDIAALHDSEINGEVSWFFDGIWRVKLGDEMNGIDTYESRLFT
jgi:hypothetical protein